MPNNIQWNSFEELQLPIEKQSPSESYLFVLNES